LACIYLIETKKSTLYKNRLALKKELADFIIEAIEAQDFDELTSAAIIDFVVNVMILPAKLESVFITHYYEKYFKMDNTDIITGRTIPFADAFTKAFFKDSYTNIIQQLREAKEVKIKAKKEIEEMKAARLKAEKAKLKAEKEAKAAKLKAEIKTENLILKLHLEQKMDSTAIASILEEKETYVKAVLSKAKNKNAKK